MSLRTPETVQKLQEALHAKAKESPDFCFYSLYDKVYRKDVLEFAYRRCRENGGSAGVDGERFEDIEAYGVERWLGERTEQSLWERGSPRPLSAPYVVAPQAQSTGKGDDTIPLHIPVRGVGSGSTRWAYAQLSVGESVSPCPKAGCGKTARPV